MTTPSSALHKARVVFMGTPDFAVPSLRRLAADHDVVAVYSQPPRRQGRGMKEKSSPVHQCAQELGIAVHCPLVFDAAAIAVLQDYAPDFLVVVAYGMILPQAVLDLPIKAPINGHASILPRWRGAAPIHRAIEAGDQETGVTAMVMQAGLDTGPMLKTATIPIQESDTTGSLHDRLAGISAEVLTETLSAYDHLTAAEQDPSGVTWAAKITPDEAEMDFTQPFQVIDRRLRAFSPFPGAWLSLGDDGGKPKRLKVKAIARSSIMGAETGQRLNQDDGDAPVIACADGGVVLTMVQPAGKPAMSGRDFLNGYAMPDQIHKWRGK